jgi:hypothetical protein
LEVWDFVAGAFESWDFGVFGFIAFGFIAFGFIAFGFIAFGFDVLDFAGSGFNRVVRFTVLAEALVATVFFAPALLARLGAVAVFLADFAFITSSPFGDLLR